MTILFNDKYEAKLSTRALIRAEQILGENPINIFASISEGKLPKLNDMLTILGASIKNINKNDIYDIYDEFIDAGHDIGDLVQFIVNLFEESGMIGKSTDDKSTDKEEDNSKNAVSGN